MATVTGLTKARMEEIEAASVVGGLVDGSGHLILSRFDASTIDAGSVIGPTGPTGPAATNGVVICTSGTRPGSPSEGNVIYETDTDRVLVYTGAAWLHIGMLGDPPACRVYNNANISINNATSTLLTFNTERYDTDTMHSTGTNPGRITFNKAGIYEVGAHVEYTGLSDWLNEYVGIRLNGGNYIANDTAGTFTVGTIAPTLSPKTHYKFDVNDYIEVFAYGHHTAGTAFNVVAVANSSPEFYATWLGRG